VSDRGTEFIRGRGSNFAGAEAFKHTYRFSYFKESKSNVYCTHIAIVDMILKRWSYNFSQCKAKSFFSKIWCKNFNQIYGKLQFASQMHRCKECVTTHQLIYTDLLLLLYCQFFKCTNQHHLTKTQQKKSLHSFTWQYSTHTAWQNGGKKHKFFLPRPYGFYRLH